MKIAYIGDCNSLGAAVAERMKKEEHDIYFLSDVSADKRGKLFSKCRNYQIKVDGDLNALFTTIRPDVVIYAGLSDAQGKNLSLITTTLEESVRIKAEMFVCLSSTEGYDSKTVIKTEETPLLPKSKNGMWISEMEHVAQMYQQGYGLNVAILRLAELFSNEICLGTNDWLGKIAESVANEESLEIEDVMLHPIYVSDVADAIKRVVEGKKSAIYNVCSSFSVKKSELIRMIAKMQGREVKVSILEETLTDNVIDNSKIKKELEWTDFWQLAKMLEDKSITIQSYRKKETESKKSGLPKKARRTLENIVLFLAFGALYVFTMNHSLFSQVNWILIYILVVSLFYGVRQGALSVLLSSALYLIMNKGNILEMTNFYSYVEDVLVIVQYIFFGIVGGYTADSLREEINNKEQDMQLLKESHEKLQDIHEKNVLVKNEYEKRLLDAKTSLPNLYNIINKINALDEERIFMEVLHVVEELLNTDTVCVYKVNPNTPYVRLIASLNDESPMSGKSWDLGEYPEIRKAIEKGEMYEGDIWKKEPAIVLPVISPEGCQAIIVIKNLPMESMSLYTANLMRTLMILISSSMEKALHYENVIRKEKYIEDTDILKSAEFKNAVELAEEKRERKLADYRVLRLDTGLDLMEAYQKVGHMFRQMDILGTDDKGNLYVLLANTSDQDTGIVLERLKKNEIVAEEIEQFV